MDVARVGVGVTFDLHMPRGVLGLVYIDCGENALRSTGGSPDDFGHRPSNIRPLTPSRGHRPFSVSFINGRPTIVLSTIW